MDHPIGGKGKNLDDYRSILLSCTYSTIPPCNILPSFNSLWSYGCDKCKFYDFPFYIPNIKYEQPFVCLSSFIEDEKKKREWVCYARWRIWIHMSIRRKFYVHFTVVRTCIRIRAKLSSDKTNSLPETITIRHIWRVSMRLVGHLAMDDMHIARIWRRGWWIIVTVLRHLGDNKYFYDPSAYIECNLRCTHAGTFSFSLSKLRCFFVLFLKWNWHRTFNLQSMPLQLHLSLRATLLLVRLKKKSV